MIFPGHLPPHDLSVLSRRPTGERLTSQPVTTKLRLPPNSLAFGQPSIPSIKPEQNEFTTVSPFAPVLSSVENPPKCATRVHNNKDILLPDPKPGLWNAQQTRIELPDPRAFPNKIQERPDATTREHLPAVVLPVCSVEQLGAIGAASALSFAASSHAVEGVRMVRAVGVFDSVGGGFPAVLYGCSVGWSGADWPL